jgi:hypothetical protein
LKKEMFVSIIGDLITLPRPTRFNSLSQSLSSNLSPSR